MAFMAEATPSLDVQRQTTLDLLTALSPCWLDLRLRYERSEHFDAKVNAEYKEVNDHLNSLLEDYFLITNGVAIERPPAQGYQVVDGRGSQ